MNSSLFSKKRSRKHIFKGVAIAVLALAILLPSSRNRISYAFEGAFGGMFQTVVDNVQAKFFGDEGSPEGSRQEAFGKPQVEVPFNMEIVSREQKSVDEGHSPWKLDPLYVTQVFVSLKLSPGGIQGDYPIKYGDLKLLKSTASDAIVEVKAKNTPIKRVYLKRLARQDKTGIWTVVGYDPATK